MEFHGIPWNWYILVHLGTCWYRQRRSAGILHQARSPWLAGTRPLRDAIFIKFVRLWICLKMFKCETLGYLMILAYTRPVDQVLFWFVLNVLVFEDAQLIPASTSQANSATSMPEGSRKSPKAGAWEMLCVSVLAALPMKRQTTKSWKLQQSTNVKDFRLNGKIWETSSRGSEADFFLRFYLSVQFSLEGEKDEKPVRISEYRPLNFHYRIGYRFFGSFCTHFWKIRRKWVHL